MKETGRMRVKWIDITLMETIGETIWAFSARYLVPIVRGN